MVTLHLVTFGLYDLYWGYRQWHAHQATHGRPIWPLVRTWFSVFYTHGLFRSLDARARAVGARPNWRPNSQAWWFVGLTFVGVLASRFMEDSAGAIALVLICYTLRVLPLIAAQRLSNEAHLLAWELVNEAAEDGDVVDEEADADDSDDEGEGEADGEDDEEEDDEEVDDEEVDDDDGADEEVDDDDGAEKAKLS